MAPFHAVWPAVLFLALIVGPFLCCLFCWCARSPSKPKPRPSRDVEAVHNDAPAAAAPDAAHKYNLRIFDYEVLSKATKSFSKEAEIGRGSFGVVYKATIDNALRAVKKLQDRIRDQTQKLFFAEIAAAGELRHRNLVQLVGYSYEPKWQALLMVFEYVPNGNLHRHLFDKLLPTLRWEDRYKIALGLASGVEYLHSGCKRCLIHRDIKPDNVMLGQDFTPQLGDFGLARLTDHDASMKTTGQGGTFGYMAPEIFTGAKATKESDVFSFGIVLLQIATGQKDLMVADVELPLVSWVWSLHDESRVLDAVDKRLPRGEYDAEQATRLLVVGLLCCHSAASERPTIDQAKSMLKVKGQPLMPVKPLEGYYKDALNKTPTRPATTTAQGATAPNKPLNPTKDNLHKIQTGSSSKYYTADEDKIIGATQPPPGRTENLAPVDNKTADAPLPPKARPRRTPESTDQKSRP